MIPISMRGWAGALFALAGPRTLFVLLLLTAVPASAASMKLAWDPVVGVPIAGYKVHYGSASGEYTTTVNVGNVTTYTVTNLVNGAPYHFAVTAYNAAGQESGYSNDVGSPDVALYRKLVPGAGTGLYSYLLDYDFDHVVDAKTRFGTAGDVPLMGYISPGGKSSLIVYRNGAWYIDTNRDGTSDAAVSFGGLAGDIPLTANFSGAGGLDDLVIYRSGSWYVDRGLNGVVDLIYRFGGVAGDVPLAADVNGDGIADLAIYRKGIWYIDTNRDGNADLVVSFGGVTGDVPLLFDWDNDGKADLCIYRNGMWYISTNRDGVANSTFGYGAAGDVPVVGRFR